MTNSNYIKVFSGDFIVVQRIVSDLENENITAVIKDETESGRLAGFGSAIQGLQEIYVHKDELEKATSIIEGINLEIEP
ncbi:MULTISPECIES: DUF2007 domain-containing protein [unclassified Algibacter]|uniref:putative signal transducing protein n=1 Tax=unclassified Algibacter TaxID=2615009 RepID=UPI00131D42E1|nr:MULTISPECIES: DUF2007 domain-containing protein [unclassified Algibacter]MCL5128332.1 DUF2007 domain-containing protein [Algibacter sp. L4_22]